MTLYGKYAHEPCHCCGKPATVKFYGLPICLDCAKFARKYSEAIKKSGVITRGIDKQSRLAIAVTTGSTMENISPILWIGKADLST